MNYLKIYNHCSIYSTILKPQSDTRPCNLLLIRNCSAILYDTCASKFSIRDVNKSFY